jgi:serine/threonine protein kinase
MSVHDPRTVRAPAGRQKSYRESADATSTIFERPAQQPVAKNEGENLNRTPSIFEWPTPQQAAKNKRQSVTRTSSIFERPPGHLVAKNEEESAKPRHTLETTEDKTKHEPYETEETLPRERRLNDNQGGLALVPQRATVDHEDRLIGRTLAQKYTIESVIGTGSMGTIYRARQIALDKWVAVKILHRELAEQPNFVERFKLEAFSASRLEHPNLLRVLDFGEDGNLLHLVMEYVEADDLLTVMQHEWPFEDARIMEIMSQALAALAKAHEAGIVHRDIKPENILILRGTDDEGNATDIVKVCDFGIAKMAPPVEESRPFAPQLTTAGLIVGTPDYMSPEQARGEGVDGRSDLYAMGVVRYHLLCGRPPFIADTPFGIAIQHVSEPPPPPSQYRAVNPVLESICLRAMNKRPEDRFQTAREMRRVILSSLTFYAESGMTCSGSEAPTEPPLRHSTPYSLLSKLNWPPRPKVIVAAVALVIVAILALAAIIARRGDQESSWGSGNVVRAATVALVPAPQANPVSSAASESAPTQPPRPTPSLLLDDAHRLGAPSESELRARPAVAAPSTLRR